MDWKKIVDNSDYEGIKKFIQSYPGDDKDIVPYAAKKGYLDMVKYLVEECGCDPHVYNEEALRKAAKNGHLEVVKYLIEECGCDPHAENEEALRLAAENGHLEVMKYLVKECGCDPHAKDEYALRWAAWNGHLDVIKYLVKKHSCAPYVKDEEALRVAAKRGNLEVVKYLVEECGCNVQKIKDEWFGYTDIFIFLYFISKGIWNESYDKVITLEDLKNAEEYLNNELFLVTVYNNTQKKNKKEFVGKLLKEYSENLRKNVLMEV